MKYWCVCLLVPTLTSADVLSDLLGGAASNPLSGLLGSGGDPLSAFSSILGSGGGSNPLDMITSLFGGRGGNDLLSLLTGGGGPTDLLSMLGGGNAAGGNLLDVFTPAADKAPLLKKEKKDCKADMGLGEMKNMFNGFLPLMPSDEIFAELDICKQKEEEGVWDEMRDFLENPPKDLFASLQRKAQEKALAKCKKALQVEEKRCQQLKATMCSLLVGSRGLEPANLLQQMKNMAKTGADTAKAESGCKTVEKMMKAQDPEDIAGALTGGAQELIFGQAVSGFLEGGGSNPIGALAGAAKPAAAAGGSNPLGAITGGGNPLAGLGKNPLGGLGGLFGGRRRR